MTERIEILETKALYVLDFEGPLDIAIANLQKELDEGWQEITFDQIEECWNLIKFREETDEEYESRLKAEEKDRQRALKAKEKRRQRALKAKEKRYEQYKKLKQEFADLEDT